MAYATFRQTARAFAIMVMLFTVVDSAYGAFCALRDPVSGIQTLFPQATHYRSIVKTIGESVRRQVRAALPPNTLHFGELGRHTLYVPVRDTTPLGFVHVRSEESEWGLVEIAWALDLDLRIVDFRFQRCRCTNKDVIESDAFKQQFIGKNFAELKAMLDASGNQADRAKLRVADEAVDIANVVLRCGLKTLLVTELAWSDDIKSIAYTTKAQRLFNNTANIAVVRNPYTDDLTAELAEELGAASVGIDRSHATVVKAYDVSNRLVGLMFDAPTRVNDTSVNVTWSISPDRRLVDVAYSGAAPNKRDRAMFERLVGKPLRNAEQCQTRADLMAFEAALTSTFHSD